MGCTNEKLEKNMARDVLLSGVPDEKALEKINRFALRELAAEEVFCFDVNACDDQLDRDFEHFSERALRDLAARFEGRTVIMDHVWSAKNQLARIYDAEVVQDGDVKRLRVRCYMLANGETKALREAIEGGILKEVSVGCRVRGCTCDLCGKNYWSPDCCHIAGREYDGSVCTVTLDGGEDAYELSFVAVPAQREAGTTKQLPQPPEGEEEQKKAIARELARVKLEAEIFNFEEETL